MEQNNQQTSVSDDAIIEVWKKVIEVQQHFNEICIKIRNIAVISVGAILTAGAFAVRDNVNVDLFSIQIPAAIPIVVIALITWIAFFLLDYHWYHRLLIGAVKQGEWIEKRHQARIPEMSLTQSISKNSPIEFEFRGQRKQIHSSTKLKFFYFVGGALLIFIVLPFLPKIQYAKHDDVRRSHVIKQSSDPSVLRDRTLQQGRIHNLIPSLNATTRSDQRNSLILN